MLKQFVMASLVLTLAACAKDDDKKKGSGNGGGSGQTVNETDTSNCRSGRPATSLDGNWTAQMRSDSIRMNLVLSFRGSQLSMSNTCTIPGFNPLTARINAIIRKTETNFTVVRGDSDTATYDDGQNRANCSVGMKDSQVVNYRFNGSCLDLIMNGETLTVVPARF